MRTILFDLENVLIQSVGRGNIHPQATDILKQSRKDFDEVGLWTACDVQEVDRCFNEILKEDNLWKYFDRVIMADLNDKNELYFISTKLRNGKKVETKILGRPSDKRWLLKDLTLLGDSNDYVLIDDGKSRRVAEPMNRIVGLEPYSGQKDHNLWLPYKQAVRVSRGL